MFVFDFSGAGVWYVLQETRLRRLEVTESIFLDNYKDVDSRDDQMEPL